MTSKLIIAILGQDCEQTINMCLESVKEADDIVYCDGGSTDDTLRIVRTKVYNDNILKNRYDKLMSLR